MKTIKTLAICLVGALLCVACGPNQGNDGTKGLILSADKYEIYDNGTDVATLKLTYNGVEVTKGYTIYDNNDEPVGKTFSSTKTGVYKFWAEYGALQAETAITVVTTPPAAPAAPSDNNPSNLDFKRRALLIQFTGTGCGYCPSMITALYSILNDEGTEENYKNDIVVAAAHIGGYAAGDPALMSEGKTIDDAFGISSYPNLVVDMIINKMAVYANERYVKSMIKDALKRVDVKGGIAVNSELHTDKNYVVATASVKAKSTTAFRIGAFLLEDGIEGVQTVYADANTIDGINYNIHNNCIRRVRCYEPNNDLDFSGYDLGTIEAGKTASYDFAFPLLKSWNTDKLHLVVFITTKEGNKWYVNNVINAPVNGLTDFEYTK